MGKTAFSRKKRAFHSVHPHAGGENEPRRQESHADAVHPHAGGENWLELDQSGGDIWFTPTRVGKTSGEP